MKYLSLVIFILCTTTLSSPVSAQGILPDITVRELTQGKVQISWINPHGENCIQLAIQRSSDSVNNFRTIFSSLSPQLPSNGYLDNRPIRGIKTYYRIFYVLQGGAYYFSKPGPIEIKWVNPPVPGSSSRTISASDRDATSIFVKGTHVFTFNKEGYTRFRDSINRQTKDALKRINANAVEWKPTALKGEQKFVSVFNWGGLLARFTPSDYSRFKDSIARTKDTLYLIDPYRIQLRPFVKAPDFISVYRNDSLIRQLDIPLYRQFRDSMVTYTRDTLYVVNNYHLVIRPFYVRYIWRPSSYVYTNPRGYVSIMLPLYKQHRYRIVFYEGDSQNIELFEIKSVKEAELVLDKANFMHAGWFSFELFENDKLKEKNKFFLSRD
jgi:hypothetical protein